MPAEARESRTPGRGLPPDRVGDGTEATTRRKLQPSTDSLALHLGSAIKTGGSTAGDEQGAGGTVQGSLKSRAPLSSSLLIAILGDHRRALLDVKAAIEGLLPKLDIDLRTDLAIVLCKVNYVLKGGSL